jgi:arylsulfatase A-like enzyme
MKARMFEMIARGAVAGLVLGVIATAVALPPLARAPQAIAAWAAFGVLVGLAAVVIAWSAAGSARVLRAAYVRDGSAGFSRLDSTIGPGSLSATARRSLDQAGAPVIAGLIIFACMLPAVLEIRGRPGFQRLASAGVLSAGMILAALVGSLVMGWLLVRARNPPRGVAWMAVLGAAAVAVGMGRLPLGAMPVAHLVLAGSTILALACASVTLVRIPAPAGAAVVLAASAAGAGLLAWPSMEWTPGKSLLVDAIFALSPDVKRPDTDRGADPDLLRQWFGRGRSGSDAVLDARVPDRRALNLVWITVCSFRKDRVGAYGSTRGLTPVLDELARRSTTFERGYTPFPASAPSMEAMFTGLYPYQLARALGERNPLPAGTETWLPEALRESGRATWELTGLKLEMLTADFRRFLDGFEVRNPYGLAGVTAETIVGAFEKLLAERSKDRPFFAWIQLMDAHAPYPGDPEGGPPAKDDEPRYDQSLRRVDRAIGKIVAAIEKAGLFDRAMLIVHGDHGEEFGDHGGRFHYTSLYEEQIAVPFIVRVPGLTPSRSADPVDLTALMPTVLEVLGVEGATGSGNSLVPVMLGRESPSCAYAEVAYASLGSLAKRMVTDSSRMKLIVGGRNRKRELYDLAADPGEKTNRAGLGDRREDELARILEALEASGARLAGLESRFPDLPQGPEPSDARARKDLADLAESTIRNQASGPAEVASSIASLTQLVDRDRGPVVLALAAHASPAVRAAVAAYAGAVQTPQGRTALHGLVADADRAVRSAAALALSSHRNPEDVARLRAGPAGMTREEVIERALLARDLGDLGPLRELSGERALSEASRVEVLAALAAAGDAGPQEQMEIAVSSEGLPLELRLKALASLRRVDPEFTWKEGTRIYLAMGENPLRRLFLDSIEDVTPRAFPILLEALGDPEPANRKRALDLLARSLEGSRIRELFAAWQSARRVGEAPVGDDARREIRDRASGVLRAAGIEPPAAR